MFSSLLRPSRSQRRSRAERRYSRNSERRWFSSTSRDVQNRARSLSDHDDEAITEEEHDEQEYDDEEDQEDEVSDTPLLPMFSAAHLDAIPVYTLAHVVRELVLSRCETTLSWEQLRSPQVSQFLIRPIQQELRSTHFNAGTEYALMTNCLQFQKEATLYPGNSGTSKTRAMLCELLAIRLLREYSTRELIDALSYDFDPLHGQVDVTPASMDGPRQNGEGHVKPRPRTARISCFEVALRAQAKRFLAHPLVVQQLEAIWAGTIVFHSAADNMHRKFPFTTFQHSYGTLNQPGKELQIQDPSSLRRGVTIYNPKDASLFKLSRLRVPRYRNLLSTISFAVLLGLFLAVLIQRSLEITPLEVVFWFWAAGYMLDEIVGFNEQGFNLYIASFWNSFDLGILLILFVHLCLRFYGIVMPDVRKHRVANMAYDVLAADAILLFPRLFSVLDHYRYFSQLLIAFRYMAQDLMAVFVLILISCSGFFVALTLSFGNEGIDTPGSVAYALLQILMGFTPAAWDRWNGYNGLGKTILTLFLFICHFLVVTILITVLTNSFMAIHQNANEEHQYVFAINTISNVKSDALFSYVAPTNIIQWAMTPLRYFLPFRQYIKANRTVIKITHFPILWSIYLYEKTVLGSSVYDAIDLVEDRGRPKKPCAPRLPRLKREPSIATFRQDRALDEVFRVPVDATLRSAQQSQDRRKTSNVVNNWMEDIGEEVASPPVDDRKVVDKLERRRPSRWPPAANRGRDFSRMTMSVVSDPEDFVSHADFLTPVRPAIVQQESSSQIEGPSQQTDADGDDELPTDDNDDDDHGTIDQEGQTNDQSGVVRPVSPTRGDYFARYSPPPIGTPEALSSVGSPRRKQAQGSGVDSPSRVVAKRQVRQHLRNVSSATMIYRPNDSGTEQSDTRVGSPTKGKSTAPASGAVSPVNKSHPSSIAAGRRTPKKQAGPVRMRPILPGKDEAAFRSAPNFAALTGFKPTGRQERRRPSLEMDLVSDLGDNKAIGGGYVGAIPSSFATQMYQASAARRQDQQRTANQDQISRLMMARMNSLEEGFREVIHEMRETIKHDSSRSRSLSRERPAKPVHREKRSRRVSPVAPSGDKENLDPSSSARDADIRNTQDAREGDEQQIK